MTPKILQKMLNLKTKDIKIGEKTVGHHHPLYFIAEAGVNYNGDKKLALKMIEVAKNAGADAVKFQTFKAEQVCLPTLPTPPYQKKNAGLKNQRKLLKMVELKESDYPRLIKRAKELKIEFLATPHGHLESAKFLAKMSVNAFKVGSGDITNLPLLAFLAKQGKPILLSTGMATLKEVKEAVQTIEKNCGQVIILHCVTNYPTPIKEANVSGLLDFYYHFPAYLIGYSDHTVMAEACLAAVCFGARVIEVHFTLNKNLPGPDQKASFEPQDLKTLITKVKLMEKILGEGFKIPSQGELKMAPWVRKSITTLKKIKKGEIFSEKNLTIRRPEKGGLKPKYWLKIIGKRAKRNLAADMQIKKGGW